VSAHVARSSGHFSWWAWVQSSREEAVVASIKSVCGSTVMLSLSSGPS